MLQALALGCRVVRRRRFLFFLLIRGRGAQHSLHRHRAALVVNRLGKRHDQRHQIDVRGVRQAREHGRPVAIRIRVRPPSEADQRLQVLDVERALRSPPAVQRMQDAQVLVVRHLHLAVEKRPMLSNAPRALIHLLPRRIFQGFVRGHHDELDLRLGELVRLVVALLQRAPVPRDMQALAIGRHRVALLVHVDVAHEVPRPVGAHCARQPLDHREFLVSSRVRLHFHSLPPVSLSRDRGAAPSAALLRTGPPAPNPGRTPPPPRRRPHIVRGRHSALSPSTGRGSRGTWRGPGGIPPPAPASTTPSLAASPYADGEP